ncbi:hypothetical protein BCR36DRAFT_89796 [Piromyces finnis]|uniref:Xrn1 N-terminal domain-containing protein n=1 Tax=Piromyces finnis TaxID=1754191 RepID=A0A1Y1VLD2_9FUNG|nr:hypothetical protein BCR36DRAFT_89796 [Piromyces finnis]|eukprot:ORX59232.1 hypothetical protein BCR36DRAFT_89796 [Piromyces finnis]
MVFRELTSWKNIRRECNVTTKLNSIDSLYIDMNGLVSNKLHSLKDSIDEYSIEELTDSIFDLIDIETNTFKPRKCVGIFFDGVSPKAKMNIQRQRRIREYYKYKDRCNFQFNSISIGTEFFTQISNIIHEKIKKIKEDSNLIWNKVKVVFSGPDVVGEAEQKIFDFIKQNSKNTLENGCIYTSDSDFYLLALANRQYHLLVYNDCNCNIKNNKSMKRNFFSVKKLYQYILSHFQKVQEENQRKIIDDFVCLCFLTENNYLPGIHDVQFNDIFEIYKENWKTIGFINNNGKLNEENLKKFLSKLNDKVSIKNKIIYHLDEKFINFCNGKEDNINSNNDEDRNYIIKYELVNHYMLKSEVFDDIQYFCKDQKSKSKDVDYKDPMAIKYLKFLCSIFKFEYKENNKILINDPENKKGLYDSDHYWQFKKYLNQNNLNINHLKNFDDKKKVELLNMCKECNIKYKRNNYITIFKGDDETTPLNIMKEIESEVYNKKDFFLSKNEEYYKRNIPNCNKGQLINQFIKGVVPVFILVVKAFP